MKVGKVLDELQERYPGKKIIPSSSDNPTEIICEVEPAREHPEYSLAVAVIDRTSPHVHKKSRETYRVVKGELDLFVEGEKKRLTKGEELVIQPGQIHWAEGDETWIECYSQPGWVLDDHILFEQTGKRGDGG